MLGLVLHRLRPPKSVGLGVGLWLAMACSSQEPNRYREFQADYEARICDFVEACGVDCVVDWDLEKWLMCSEDDFRPEGVDACFSSVDEALQQATCDEVDQMLRPPCAGGVAFEAKCGTMP